MFPKAGGTGRGFDARVLTVVYALLGLSLALPSPSSALNIVAGSLSVSRSFDSGSTWVNVSPGETITVGDQIRVIMTLENDTGLLGNMCADLGPPVPEPGSGTCVNWAGDAGCAAWNNGYMDQGVSGQWPGQYWVWPLMGKCPNGLYPDVGDSPVELVSAESVSSFGYDGAFLDVVEAYDPLADAWTTKTAMPTARAKLGVAAAGGKIYAIGGRNGSGVLGVNEEYDPVTDAWTTKAAMPTPREGLAVAAAGGKIYAFGGRGATGTVLNKVEEYDPGTNTWTTKTAMPTPRYGCAAAELAGIIHVAGGLDNVQYNVYPNVEEYDPVANSWTSGNAFTSRGDPAAASDGTYAWFAGGWDWFAVHGTTEGYESVGPSWTGGGGMNFPRTRMAMSAVAGKLYAVGGSADNGWGMGTIEFPANFWGNNEEYDPGGGFWTPKANIPTPREWLGAATGNDGAADLVYAVGGYTGYLYNMIPGAPNNTARVSWTFTARTEWTGLDFSVFGMDIEDGNWCNPGPQEGSFFSCISGSFQGDSTLQTIFATYWGTPLNIVSQFKCSSRAEVFGPGTRPPGVAYLGDTVRVFTSITNTGALATLNGIDACSAHHPYSSGDSPNGPFPKGNVCVMPVGIQGACSPNNSEVGSPPLPDSIANAENKIYTWDYLVSGYGFAPGYGPCSTGGVGSGSAYFDVNIQGSKSETATLYIQPAPLLITATAWVDPDGPSSAVFSAIPMGVSPGGAGAYYYYMGQESINATFIFTNTSTVFSFDIQPDVAVGGFDPTAFLMVAGPEPPGALMLAPLQSATVFWAFTRTPGGTLDSCAPSIIGNVATFTAAARGNASTQSVEIQDVPFRPLDAVPLGTTVGSRNLTLELPLTAPTGAVFAVNLYAKNGDNRPFVLDAKAAFYLTRSSYGGAIDWTSSPAPPPQTWLAGQEQTMQFQYLATGQGEIRFMGGLDFASLPPPCQTACARGTVPSNYCNSTDGYYPWMRMFCTMPGAFSTSTFTATPVLSCDDAGQVVLVRLGVKNTSSIFCAVVTQFCDNNYPDTFPTGYAMPYAKAPVPYPALASPSPMTPFTIAPNATQLVTWYMDANCPPTPGGNLSFGCFSGTYRMVEGYTVNCGTGAIINPADGANWGGATPTVSITQPAYLSCSIWADNSEYSVGQTITVFFSVSNEGGDDLSSFGVGSWPVTFLGAGVGPPTGPVPAAPATYPGAGVCMPFPPYASNQTFVWQFQALSKGKVYFTATAMGWDASCGTWKMTSCTTPAIGIKSEAALACAAPTITSVVTMSVTCTGCPPASGCDPATGSGCLNVSMDLSNFGDIRVENLLVSQSNAYPALRVCAAGSCTTAGPASLSALIPPPGELGSLASGTAVWRYSPVGLTGPGCMQVHVEAFGIDGATGVTLFCDGWTACSAIKARYPMGLSLVSVPAQIAPGQEFPVQVKVCNPGETPASLQSGQPAFQFFQAATGAKVTEEYDVMPPAPVVLQPGECRTIEVTVVAHRNAQGGMVEVRVAQGSQFVAMDAATGLPFQAVDTGVPVITQLINLQNKLVVVGSNQTRILRHPVVLNYQIADAGRQNGKTTLRIYTISGELVRTLVDKAASIEEASVPWDGRNDSGQLCASGIYLARLESPTYSRVVKVAILK